MQDQDLIPMIRSISVNQAGEKCVELEALVCCQNPTLNPAQLIRAIEIYIPQYAPDFSTCMRIEIFDKDYEIFR